MVGRASTTGRPVRYPGMLLALAKLAPVDTDPAPERPGPREPQALDAFLAAIAPRAFRFAEAGLRHRDDALDVVQDAMLKMLNYRERPAGEWTPLFWSILRSRIIDAQRRRTFRLGWLDQVDRRYRILDRERLAQRAR